MKKKIKELLAAQQGMLLFAIGETIIKITFDDEHSIFVYYKDNDMDDFVFGLCVSTNVKDSVALATILAFIEA